MIQSTSRNSLLLSLVLNLALLVILSLVRESSVPQSREAIDVKFVNLPKETPRRRALIRLPRYTSYAEQPSVSTPASARVIRKIESPRSESAVSIGAVSTDDLAPGALPASSRPTVPASAEAYSAGGWGRGSAGRGEPGSVGAGQRGSGIGGQVGDAIASRQPKALISGSGDKLSGYYNISLVRYEDTSDTISTDALTQLAVAMNRWTQIRTKVIKEPIMLDDPELLQVPMIYITSQRAFAFSERERENLQTYFARGGFLLFSNAAVSDSEARGVANSIEFELWKVLSGAGHDLVDARRSEIYSSFFILSSNSLRLRGASPDDRISVIYEDSGYGFAWAEENPRELYLKLGVNVIVYALTTSPMVQRY